MATKFALKLAALAETEFNKYNGVHETVAPMPARIKQFWIGLGMKFPGVSTAWSAVFVSFQVKMAGATVADFPFAAAHAKFVHEAIKNFKAGTGRFHGRKITDYAPKIGDIIQNNRGGNTYDYNFAGGHSAYESHSAIVVEEGSDGFGSYVRTIGGNEGDTVGDRVVRLNASGLIKQPASDPKRFICVIQTLM